MTEIHLPPINQPSDYKTSYNCDYEVKRPLARVPLRPTSSSRKHNPQPRHVFLLRRMFNEPVCNVWTPPKLTVAPTKSAIDLANKTLTTCAKSSYRNPNGHPNFQQLPTRFGSNKQKKIPAIGIVPVTSVLKNAVRVQVAVSEDSQSSEPLNMEIMGTKRKLSTPYVLDQHLSEYEAIKDMKARTEASQERYLSQSVQRPSRRKHVQTRKPSLSGSSPLVKQKKGKSKDKNSDMSKVQRDKGEFYSLHQPWPACYSCWAGPI